MTIDRNRYLLATRTQIDGSSTKECQRQMLADCKEEFLAFAAEHPEATGTLCADVFKRNSSEAQFCLHIDEKVRS